MLAEAAGVDVVGSSQRPDSPVQNILNGHLQKLKHKGSGEDSKF